MNAVILVHGLLGTPSTHFQRCRDLWGRTVVEVALAGHGAGDPLPDHPVRVAVERVRAAIREQAEPPVVVGLSYLGASVALRAAEGMEDAVHGVVMSGFSLLVTPSTIGRWLDAFSEMAGTQQRTRDHFGQLHGPGWEDLLTSVTDELADGCLRLPGRSDIETFGVPILLLNGALLENERLAVLPAAEAGADVAVVAGAGHLVPQDSPRTFVAAVEEFGERISAQRTVFHERRRTASRIAGPEPATAHRDRVGADTKDGA